MTQITFGTPEANAFIEPALKPCPFCGTNNLTIEHDEPRELYEVYCIYCNITGPMSHVREQAIANWNTRPNDDN